MQVTIFGAGNMGRGIGTRLVAGGHDVQFLAPSDEGVEALVDELEDGEGDVQGGSADDDVTGDVVVLAVPYNAAESIVKDKGDQLEGKVVVDITNPVDFETFDDLVTPSDSSAAEELAKNAPEGTQVVKAFNTTFASTLVEGETAGQPLDVFIAGDDDDAKATVRELVESGGLNPIDAGPLKRARELERLGFLHMTLQDGMGTGFASAVRILS